MYTGLAALFAFVALAVGLFGLRLLFGGSWIAGWLRGMSGLALTIVAAALVFVAWDLQGYRRLHDEQPIATLSFDTIGPRHFAVQIDDGANAPQQVELRGDMWQLDVRLLKWNDSLLRLGLQPGYQLDRLAGRYLSLEDERSQPRTVVGLRGSKPHLDIWPWLRQLDRYIPLVDARYGSATYLPMRDGARYAVNLAATGLVARPLNAPAERAVQQWQ